MGIDVYTAGLALHVRNLADSTGSRILDARHPLTSDGVAAARRDEGAGGENVGVFSAVLVARRLATLAQGTVIGLPFGHGFGTGFDQEVDQLDAKWWCKLPQLIRAIESGAVLDEAMAVEVARDDPDCEASFLHERWNKFPGVAFARAVDICSSIVLPSRETIAFAAGTAAIVSTAEAVRFFGAIARRLGVDRRQLEVDYDPELPEAQNRLLYNHRLLYFHVREADRSRRALGIWG